MFPASHHHGHESQSIDGAACGNSNPYEMEGFESIPQCLLLVVDSSIEVVRGLLFDTEYISESLEQEIISEDL